jgi:hypothetical protein
LATAYAVQSVSRAGVTPAAITPAVTGDTFPAGGSTYLRLITSGTAATLTITPPAGGGPLGTTIAPFTFVLPATGVREIGPFPQNPFGDANGNVNISYSSITGLTVEAKTYSG